MLQIIKNVDVDIEYKSEESPTIVENFFPYIGYPCHKSIDYKSFCTNLKNQYVENKENGFYDDKNMTVSKLTEKLDQIINPNIKYIYTNIDYPLDKPANFQFTLLKDIDVTYGMILYIYTASYQLVYQLEETYIGNTSYIHSMLNRDKSYGPYGIWGHAIEDLIYNGESKISIYSDSVVCYFSCDS